MYDEVLISFFQKKYVLNSEHIQRFVYSLVPQRHVLLILTSSVVKKMIGKENSFLIFPKLSTRYKILCLASVVPLIYVMK